MSRWSPYDTAPQLVERKPGLVDMMIRDQPGVQAYRLWGSKTIDDAYGNPATSGVGGAGPEAMLEVEASLQFRSPSVIQRRWSWYGESLRGMSRVAFDPNDYVTDPTTNFPGDDDTWFVRLQECRTSVGNQVSLGSIDLNAVAPTDTVLIAGVTFTAIPGVGVPAAQTFQGSAGGAVAATQLIAAINEGTTSQPLLLAAPPAGVTVTASAGAAADQVLLTASVAGPIGDQITLTSTGGILVSGPAMSGGGTFLTVRGPVNAGDPKLGSIYVVPPAIFFGQPQPGISLYGTAPGNTTCTAGALPALDLDMQVPNPMHIVLPRWTATCFVNNLSGADTLLVSAGWGQQMISAGPTEDAIEWGGGVKELVLAGVGATAPPFSIYAIGGLGPGVK